jgi:hypothetical protein
LPSTTDSSGQQSEHCKGREKKNLLATNFKLLSKVQLNSISDRDYFSSYFPLGAAIMTSHLERHKTSYATDKKSIIGTGKLCDYLSKRT